MPSRASSGSRGDSACAFTALEVRGPRGSGDRGATANAGLRPRGHREPGRRPPAIGSRRGGHRGLRARSAAAPRIKMPSRFGLGAGRTSRPGEQELGSRAVDDDAAGQQVADRPIPGAEAPSLHEVFFAAVSRLDGAPDAHVRRRAASPEATGRRRGPVERADHGHRRCRSSDRNGFVHRERIVRSAARVSAVALQGRLEVGTGRRNDGARCRFDGRRTRRLRRFVPGAARARGGERGPSSSGVMLLRLSGTIERDGHRSTPDRSLAGLRRTCGGVYAVRGGRCRTGSASAGDRQVARRFRPPDVSRCFAVGIAAAPSIAGAGWLPVRRTRK